MTSPPPDLSRVEACLSSASPDVRATLASCLEGRDLSVDAAIRLCSANGTDLHALCLTADTLRREQVGEAVTYVVNRNINFTNVCVKSCKFCAFAKSLRSEEGYFLDEAEVVRRALEAQALGATEVCIQAGLAPGVDGRIYVNLCKALKAAAPNLDVHAFSPEEVKYGAELTGISVRAYLEELKAAGLGSLPGTSAEVLDERVRDVIAPGRITTAEWVDVITTAHALGIPTTSTLMFGHVETAAERMRHLDLLRSIQRDTGGFTEFVPLSFVHQEAPLANKRLVAGLRRGPTGNEVIRLFAIARLMLGTSIKNLQAAWVKEGPRQAQWLLSCGANDLGGTLMNESISTSAGASHGQFMSPRALRGMIREAGRVPVQRNTRYQPLQVFAEEATEADEPLDAVADADATFGTYAGLTREGRFRFVRSQA